MKRKLVSIKDKISSIFNLSKRQQFVGVTSILTLLLMATQLSGEGLRYDFLVGLAVIAYVLSAFVLRYDLSGWEYLTLLTLPAFYTGALYLFYLLLPTRWLTRLPIAILYAIGMYAILLTENIYNVAAERNIQLLRAAHSVGFLLTLITLFFLMDTLVSLHLPFYLNIVLTAVIVFPLTLQAFWSMELAPMVSSAVWLSSLVVTDILTGLVVIFSFWPIGTTIEALFLTTAFYTLVGMTQQQIIGRLFSKTAREFSAVLIIVFLLVIITTRWGSGIQ